MRRRLRRLRGALGVGISWAVVWGLVGGVLEAVFGLPPGSSGLPIVLQEFVRGFVAFAGVGFLGSGVFSLVLSLEGRRRSFAEMSVPRFALWGGLAGLTVGLVLSGAHLLTLAVTAAIGASSAAASLALARSADDRTLLASSGEMASLGLTEQEEAELLGRPD